MRSVTELPLHGGKAPKWLFGRMTKLGRAISLVIMDEFGPDELLRRLSDSNWFQALSCAIGYDWHSSGTTTVTIGALKESLNDTGEIFIAGGKGKEGLRTPTQIEEGTARLSIGREADRFKESSRLAAKTDSSMIYDGIGIYHHAFLFTKSGKWAVVQQAMHKEERKAIRFQWFSDGLDAGDMLNEPHSGMGSSLKRMSLDLTSTENAWVRESSADAAREVPHIEHYPHRHGIVPRIDLSPRAVKAINTINEIDPEDYKELLLIKGVGRSALRSLAFVASLIYDKELAYRDPVAYAYNLGGKDGIPFPVPRKTYDSVIKEMEGIVDSANMERGERYGALRRLSLITNTTTQSSF